VGKARATRRWYRWTERWAVVGCLVVVVALFSALRPSTYATFSNLQSVLTSQATLLIVALLLTVVLAAGDLNLSIGGMITFSAVIVAVLSVNDQLPFVAALTRDNILGVVYGGRAHAAPAKAAS
jgi:ribose transport system permease protein